MSHVLECNYKSTAIRSYKPSSLGRRNSPRWSRILYGDEKQPIARRMANIRSTCSEWHSSTFLDLPRWCKTETGDKSLLSISQTIEAQGRRPSCHQYNGEQSLYFKTTEQRIRLYKKYNMFCFRIDKNFCKRFMRARQTMCVISIGAETFRRSGVILFTFVWIVFVAYSWIRLLLF